jgi:hypothetical protein
LVVPEAICNECGTHFDEPFENRRPCPTCGSLARRIELSSTVVISTADGKIIDVHVTDDASGQDVATGEVNAVLEDATVVATGTVGAKATVAQYHCELVWDAPTDEDDPVPMLRVFVNGEEKYAAMRPGDSFDLLFEVMDTQGSGVLPPWSD